MDDKVIQEKVVNDTAEQLVEIENLEKRGFSVEADTGKIVSFNANFFAYYIRRRMKILYSKDGFFHIYSKGVWQKKEDAMMYKTLRNILQEPRFGVWNRRYEDEYIATLKREVYHPYDMNPMRHIINLQNGVFDINTLQFLPHDPKYLSTIQIPVEYDENAECPNFLKFLDEIFEGDAERIAVAQEWFGYAMTTETKAQKVLILYGSGGNGKGVFVEILSLMIGEENISHIPLNELHKGFSRVCLYGKTANICSENESDGKPINTQYFKAIVGEDTINAEQKNKPVFSFKPTAKLILSMNNLPKTKDRSTGYYRRLMILCFTAYFGEESRDKDLKEKLREELPGIFLWAIEGLNRLRDNDYKFSECGSMDAVLREYQKEQNPIIEFVEECIEKVEDNAYREDNKVVYDSFKAWAEKNGHSGYASVSSQRFWKEFEAVVKAKGYNCKAGRSNDFRYHTGIKVSPQYRVEVKTRPKILKTRKSSEEELFLG
jgi:putative DNA primase/helicase